MSGMAGNQWRELLGADSRRQPARIWRTFNERWPDKRRSQSNKEARRCDASTRGGGRLVVELTPDEAAATFDELSKALLAPAQRRMVGTRTLPVGGQCLLGVHAQENSDTRWRPACP